MPSVPTFPEVAASKKLGAVHIVAWADGLGDLRAADPLTRRGSGGVAGGVGPSDGVVAASVNRVGRQRPRHARMTKLLTSQGRVVVTAGKVGI